MSDVKFSFSDVIRVDIEKSISERLSEIGIMFRIFSRVKDSVSLNNKLKNKKYGSEKKIQDALGVRVVLYFNDDVEIVHKMVNGLFKEREKDQSIDIVNTEEFSAVRYNIIYEMPSELLSNERNFELVSNVIDSTFELQIRSVLSEGWHEVEHDLRYKSKSDWASHDGESRRLNGIYATLETSEWTMIKIFDELSYKHYKLRNWESMLRQKFRLRIQSVDFDERIKNYFDLNLDVAKEFFRVSRKDVVNDMAAKGFSLPLNVNTLIYFCNEFYVKDDGISAITPSYFKGEFPDDP